MRQLEHLRPFIPNWRCLCCGALAALAAWLFTQLAVVHGLEEWMLDGCFHSRGRRPTQAKVVIVGLDEYSLDEVHKPLAFISPELASVVTYLKQRGAAAIGIDLIDPEALDDLDDLREGKPGDATKLGQAVFDAGNVVLAVGKTGGGWIKPLHAWRLKSYMSPDPTDLGFTNATEDPDHFARRQQLYDPDGDSACYHIALALLARATHKDPAWSGSALSLGGEPIPLDDEQMMRINYVGPPG
jgi:CHASE2 domain-containing sensor protein